MPLSTSCWWQKLSDVSPPSFNRVTWSWLCYNTERLICALEYGIDLVVYASLIRLAGICWYNIMLHPGQQCVATIPSGSQEARLLTFVYIVSIRSISRPFVYHGILLRNPTKNTQSTLCGCQARMLSMQKIRESIRFCSSDTPTQPNPYHERDEQGGIHNQVVQTEVVHPVF